MGQVRRGIFYTLYHPQRHQDAQTPCILAKAIRSTASICCPPLYIYPLAGAPIATRRNLKMGILLLLHRRDGPPSLVPHLITPGDPTNGSNTGSTINTGR